MYEKSFLWYSILPEEIGRENKLDCHAMNIPLDSCHLLVSDVSSTDAFSMFSCIMRCKNNQRNKGSVCEVRVTDPVLTDESRSEIEEKTPCRKRIKTMERGNKIEKQLQLLSLWAVKFYCVCLLNLSSLSLNLAPIFIHPDSFIWDWLPVSCSKCQWGIPW